MHIKRLCVTLQPDLQKKAYPNLTIQKNITHKIMGNIIKPIVYTAALDMKQTEHGIKQIKEFFQQNLSTELRLRRMFELSDTLIRSNYFAN